MIKDKDACCQFIDYSGLAYSKDFKHDKNGLYHPMDFDAVYQFSKSFHKEMNVDEAFFLYEFKKGDARMSKGEEISYTKTANFLAKGGGFAVVAVVSHSDEVEDGDIDGAKGIVTKFYCGNTKKWYEPTRPLTAREFTDSFMRRIGFDIKEEN